ncbi:DUF3488 and transglutaminase-like domain-containing protein [Streptomyces sp. P38-E01]|uniref:DUF3488 and transglutaminase-like domain-containing protein n=1 Tax=Streptomyces tardus TaxID=2780544 RepID=A0A949JHH2_9ACTN|nr:DUF3488 and transglutaminase-like domain-containing protein [Streptomyces tardus]MBU7599547.1 DUF3488 and transglutaminase-like domain-containing protein [Streptomyces tardus]
MSGGARLTLAAWWASVACACALLPLVSAASWLFQAAALLAVQSAVGMAARRVPLARPVTITAQLLVSFVLLTLVFAQESALGGVLPTPASVEQLGLLVGQGSEDVTRFTIPAPLTDGIQLMLVGGALAIGLLVDVIAVTFRSAAPAGLPLLALYSVAAGLGQGEVSWLWFLVAATGYLLLLLAEGRDRISQWGRVFSGAAMQRGFGQRSEPPVSAPVRTGRRIGVATLGLALLVPALLPSLGSGVLDPAGRGSGSSSDGTVSAVNPLVALQDSLNQPENRTVLTYRTNAQSNEDMYLRIVSLDQFDGTAWKPSERRITSVPDPLPDVPGMSPDVDVQRTTTLIEAADWYKQSWLPMPYPAQRVDVDGRWRFEPEGRTLVGDRGQTTQGANYQVVSLQVRPTAEQLKNAPPAREEIRREYTDVPGSLPREVESIARNVVQGSDSDYERALALQEWFAREGGFTYNTEVRAGSGSAAITRFLDQREGFCIHFAFSMAAMARTLDIPARVAVGFTPGTPASGGRTEVGLQDAHAWPELYFEGVGWTRFEPTPSRGNTPGYAQPDLPDPSVPEDEETGPEETTGPGPEPTEEEECTAERRQAGECGELDAVGPPPGDGGFPWQRAALITVAALAVLTLPLLPALWRIRARGRRLAASGGPAAGSADAVLAAWRELLDTGWDFGIAPDDSATPRKAVRRLITEGRLDADSAAAAHRVADAVERVLYAPSPARSSGADGDPAADVHTVRAGLRSVADRRTGLRALLAPRSAVRVGWAVRRRWAFAAEQARARVVRAGAAVRSVRRRRA